MGSFFICPSCRNKIYQLYPSKLYAWQLRAPTRRKFTDSKSAHEKNRIEAVPPFDPDNFHVARKDHYSTDTNSDNRPSSNLPTSDNHTDVKHSKDGNSQENIKKTYAKIEPHGKASEIVRGPSQAEDRAPNFKVNYYQASDLSIRLAEERTSVKDGKFRIRFTNLRPGLNPVPSRQRSQYPSSDDGLELMFKETIAHSNSPSTADNSVSDYQEKVTMLTTMISQNRPLSETWKYFRETFSPNPHTKILNWKFKFAFQSLLQVILHSKRHNPFDSRAPTIAEVADVYIQFGFLTGKEWADLLTCLLGRLALIKGQAVNDNKLVSEILDAWDVACREPNGSVVPLSSAVAKSFYKEHGLLGLFRLLVPQLNSRDFAKVPLVAIATFSMLTSESISHKNSTLNVTLLIQRLASILSVPNLDINHIVIKEENSVLKPFVLKNWIEIRAKAQQISDSIDKTVTEAEEHQSFEDQGLNNKLSIDPLVPPNVPIRGIKFIHYKLSEAINLKNHAQVDQLWAEALTWPILDPECSVGKRSRDGFLSVEICNQFILAYMKFQRPNEAIRVWNHMMQKGLIPTTKTWNVLMSGCRIIRDWKSAETIWERMIQTGLQPDNISWSARISLLMECKEFDMGIRALDEMGRIWLAAAMRKHPKMDVENIQLVDDVEDVPKPDIFCLNTAVTGLLAQGKKANANQTLAWGQSLGIKPNVVTYNIFLRPLVRNGYRKEAMVLLKRMKKAGIEADIATYTIILDQILRDPGQYSPEQQKEMVNEIFADMKSVDIKPNTLTYGKIIYQLTRNCDPANTPTVEALLRQMEFEGMKPTVQIYTTLVEYYFFQDPPNMDAARQTIDQATSIVGLDRVFWDKVVNCYAQVGDTDTALGIISMLTSKKTRVGWAAMRSVLESLVHKEEWELAKSLVRDTQINTQRLDFREGTQGEAMFWEVAKKMNLMESIDQ
ncbi:hypothetical protein K3495_g6485 [Podosphaera aphanis]|nr:hypothetical protein K3495_g6485 [Podosphaera aphanis]